MTIQNRILVTGANGFVGQRLCHMLLAKNYWVRAVFRSEQKIAESKKIFEKFSNIEYINLGELDEKTNWEPALKDVSIIVHLAARVHVMDDKSADPLAEFRKINVMATKLLAKSAVNQGVKRLIYISSVKVNGEATDNLPDKKFKETDLPQPQDPYGQSKWEAEQILQETAHDLEYVIIRPPLIYGKNVKGNFRNLINSINKGYPLPLGNIQNQRSMIYVENLCEAIIQCLENSAAKNKTYLVSDAEPISTTELIRKLASAMQKPARLFSIPIPVIRLLGKCTRKSPAVDRLLSSLVIDHTKICQELNWHPQYTLSQALQRDFGNQEE